LRSANKEALFKKEKRGLKMQDKILWVLNEQARGDYKSKTSIDFVSPDEVKKVRGFHKNFAEYKVTPLWDLQNLAGELGVSKIWVKDESYRFGLNAFKVLGGSYAIGKYLSEKLGMEIKDLTFDLLKSPEIKKKLGDLVFVTATDGNHGRGVAWAARQLGQKAVVFMPKGSVEARIENIKREGAQVFVTDFNYDESVRMANEYAQQHNGIMVQDTAWDNYVKIPTWIMQGYATIADEVNEQLKGEMPTHIFLQAGVGSFATTIIGYFANLGGENRPVSVIVEPDKADCFYKSAKINDGQPHAVTGGLETIMAGLSCGEPNIIAWDIARDYADAFFSCPDYVSSRGTRILANPLGNDPRVISGESGSVGAGLISLLLEQKAYQEVVKLLKLDQHSKILVISTEGDTDPVRYRKILWDGFWELPEEDSI
jgi:diaminopropionate ammonia-lyase